MSEADISIAAKDAIPQLVVGNAQIWKEDSTPRNAEAAGGGGVAITAIRGSSKGLAALDRTDDFNADRNVLVNKHFKIDTPGYTPQNDVEAALVEKLNKIPMDKTWGARHSKGLDFSLKDEPRYFLPDGSANPKALLEKGTTTVTMHKHEVTNKDNVSRSAQGRETDWGIEADMQVYEETGDASNPIKKTKERSVEVRSDSEAYQTGDGEEVVEMMAKFDIMDDRAARMERWSSECN